MLRGGCLCGAVRYEVHGPLGPVTHCHCAMCRKAHGAAFGTYGDVKWADFRVLSGEDEIASFRSSSRVRRTFCRRCGATLQWILDSGPAFSLALGTLDDDPGVRPQAHIFVASKAPWVEITDGLPQHAQSTPRQT